MKRLKAVFLWLGIFIFIPGLLQTVYSLDIKGLLPQASQTSKPANINPSGRLGDIVTYAATLAQEYYSLRNQIKINFDSKKAQQKLSELYHEINNLYKDVSLFKNASHLSYRRLSYFKAKLFYESKSIDWMNKSLSVTLKDLIIQRNEWLKRKKTLLKHHTPTEKMQPQSVERKAFG